MANFMRNWRRPSRVCLYVLSGVNFSVLFLCMSPSRTIICTQSSENTFLPKTNIRVIFQKPGFLTLVVQSHQPAQLKRLHVSPTWPPGCWSAPAPPAPPSPTSPFRCECISRSRLTQSVSQSPCNIVWCLSYTPVSINKLRTKYFAIFASNRPSAFLKHSKI